MDQITLSGMISLALLKKERFTGSFHEMRYRLCKEEDQLMASTYPQPYCWDKTPDDQKESRMFAFSEEGLSEAIEWLNQAYIEKYRK